jgi:hypothetical protein
LFAVMISSKFLIIKLKYLVSSLNRPHFFDGVLIKTSSPLFCGLLLCLCLSFPALATPPDGTLVFEARIASGWQLFIAELPDGEPIQLTDTPALDAETPAFNGDAELDPEGEMLVFTSNRSGEDEIYLARLTANNRLVDLVQLTDAPGIQAFPALSGASDYLLYHSEGAENWLIHDCRILTGESQPITDTGDNLFPALSPDGLRYAYASTRDDNWELYLYTPETGIEERLTEDPAADLYAAFSPDDTALVFSSKRGDGATYDLYTLDLETGEVAELLVDPAASLIYPAWYPGVFFYHIQRGEHSRIGWLDTDSGETGELDLLPGVDLGHPAFLPAMD